MSKQRKAPDQLAPPGNEESRAVAPESAAVDWETSNEAARQAMSARPAGAAELAAAVERASLALQLTPRADAERLVSILEGSRIAPDRVDALVDRIRSEAALAAEISAAVERWFGSDSAEVRGAVSDGFAALLAEPSAPAPEPLVGLARQIALLAWFDEDEEEALLAEYAAEESA